MRIVLISGVSGSGKSIALKLMEDVGFVCVDNLPLPMVTDLAAHYAAQPGVAALGVSIDIRARCRLDDIADLIAGLREQGHRVDVLFLDADDAVLLRRFSETRRSHPLAGEYLDLLDSIRTERDWLRPIRALAFDLDTTDLTAPDLRQRVKAWLAMEARGMVVSLESFGFKYGTPNNLDFMFDVRCLPNPFYDPVLRPFSGQDAPIIDFFAAQPRVAVMIDDIGGFLQRWLPVMAEEGRGYVNIGIGCTGGRHRSVYVVEALARQLAAYALLVRHSRLPAAHGALS